MVKNAKRCVVALLTPPALTLRANKPTMVVYSGHPRLVLPPDFWCQQHNKFLFPINKPNQSIIDRCRSTHLSVLYLSPPFPPGSLLLKEAIFSTSHQPNQPSCQPPDPTIYLPPQLLPTCNMRPRMRGKASHAGHSLVVRTLPR
jgi:hypothetical protein